MSDSTSNEPIRVGRNHVNWGGQIIKGVSAVVDYVRSDKPTDNSNHTQNQNENPNDKVKIGTGEFKEPDFVNKAKASFDDLLFKAGKALGGCEVFKGGRF